MTVHTVIMLKDRLGGLSLLAGDQVTGEYMNDLATCEDDGTAIKYVVTIKKAKPESLRTVPQQNAIEVFCRQCAAKCVEGGLDLRTLISRTRSDTMIPVSQQLFKDVVFKGIQTAMLGKISTTKLSTAEVGQVYNVINKFTSERLGFSIPWPSKRG